jgi:hypothetical protein
MITESGTPKSHKMIGMSLSPFDLHQQPVSGHPVPPAARFFHGHGCAARGAGHG